MALLHANRFVVALMVMSSTCYASQVEVVLAHHSEDLTWLSHIPGNVGMHVYTKGPEMQLDLPMAPGISLHRLPNVGRESHTYLSHIVNNYENLADWTVFTQAGEPSFGYKGHRSGGGHLMAGDSFLNYLEPDSSGSRFVYTSAVQLPSMNHVLRASYCINDDQLEGGVATTCPAEASQWSPWWDIGEFRNVISSKVHSQHGDKVMDFYRQYINPEHIGDELVAFFPQGARFAVSREKIQQRPKADYERLLATLSDNEDSYAGYYMEWLWSELFLGHQEPCSLPARHAPVSHAQAMSKLIENFPSSVARHLSTGGVSGSGISGGISSGISGGISGGVSGGISGGISGGVSGGISGGVSGSNIAGTFEVVLEVQGQLTQEIIEDMFKRAIAESLEVPLANVVELIASEIVQGARRLSAVQAKRYTVSYEVVVPSTMSVDALIEKANRIASAGSVESQVFRQVLTATDGVEQVSQMVIKIPAQVGQIEEIMAMSVDKTPTQTDEGKNWTALIIGAIAIVLAVTCLASSAVFLMRRRNADSKSAGNDRSATYESAQV